MRVYASSNRRGSSFTLNMPPLACGRMRTGACMRGGVCCHLGLYAKSVSCWASLDDVVLEKVHAEVRTIEAFCEGAGRSDDDALERRQRNGRLDAIFRCKRWCRMCRIVRGRLHRVPTCTFSEHEVVRKVAARMHFTRSG